MDKFNFSIGPFELFSSFIAGIPILIAAYLLIFPTINPNDLELIKTPSLTTSIFIIVLSYILRALITGITWQYFKIAQKLIFWLDYAYPEKSYLLLSKDVNDKMSLKEFLSQDLKNRISFFAKKRFGEYKFSQITILILPYLREFGTGIATKAEYFMANKIMFRTLSFGFLILALVLIRCLYMNKDIAIELSVVVILCLIFSFMALHRSIVFRQWFGQEILLGFYHIETKNYLEDKL